MKQSEQTIQERMAPYREKISKLKEEVTKQDNYFPTFEIPSDYTDLAAALAFFEEYELFERFLGKKPSIDMLMLNACVSQNFSFWQPTPLYFVTLANVQSIMKDPCKMIRFLVSRGANVNQAAGDGSTPLCNLTNYCGSLELLQTLLELDANPNLKSITAESEWMPLANSLLPNTDEIYDDKMPHIDALAINKAKLLLEYGANPNLVNSTLPDYPPLILTLIFGFPQHNKQPEILELIELLLKSGADPNFTDSEDKTPLIIAEETNLFDAGKLLLLYGAKMPTDEELKSRKIKQMQTTREKYETAPDMSENNPIFKELEIIVNNDMCVLLAPAATSDDLFLCDCELSNNDYPVLPNDYANFLKIYGGYAFDSVELYGTDEVTDDEEDFTLLDIVSATIDFNSEYVDEGYLDIDYYLLCFGRQNGDYFTYDPVTAKYQMRSHECITDIWDEYDTFEDFFTEEVIGYSFATEE